MCVCCVFVGGRARLCVSWQLDINLYLLWFYIIMRYKTVVQLQLPIFLTTPQNLKWQILSCQIPELGIHVLCQFVKKPVSCYRNLNWLNYCCKMITSVFQPHSFCHVTLYCKLCHTLSEWNPSVTCNCPPTRGSGEVECFLNKQLGIW